LVRSLREFSRLVGVSPATVSRVFSGSGKVAPETHKRILELAEKLGFRPSAVGQVAFGGDTRSVGVLVPTLEVSFYAQVVSGLQEHLLDVDYLPIVLQSNLGDSDTHAVKRLLDHRVDAMLLTFSSEALTPDDLGIVLRAKVPVVLLGAFRASLALDAIDNDDVAGARTVGEHLVSLGHRRFGFCYFGEGHSNADLRLAGFREALATHALALPDTNIIRLHPHHPNRETFMHDELLQLLSRTDRPTAIFASTDDLARAVYAVAKELKLQIPRDLSVVGYANLNFASQIEPPLTTVDQNGREMGKRAAQIILDRLENPTAPHRVEIIPAQLVIRASTARPPK